MRVDDFSATVMGRMAPAGHTSEQRVHSGRQYPSSYDISGCISVSKFVEGRSTLLGHSDTQSWHAVQCGAKWRMLFAPGGTRGVLRLGFCLASMAASPPSTFYSCALIREVAARVAERVRNLRRISSPALSPPGVSTPLSLGEGPGVRLIAPCLQVSIQSIHATQRL